MQIEDPNDLIRLCYEYSIKQIPVLRNGSIEASIEKKKIVGHLRKSEGFKEDIQNLIDEFSRSVNSNFLTSLKNKLEKGTISGIPVLNSQGEVVRTITPGVLEAEEESRKFLNQALQKELYEQLFEEFPFPLELSQNEDVIFDNFNNFSEVKDWSEWETKQWAKGDLAMKVYFPEIVMTVLRSLKSLNQNESIEIRELLDTIESAFLRKAFHITDSISNAAEKVGLPRQTFDYRWDKFRDSE